MLDAELTPDNVDKMAPECLRQLVDFMYEEKGYSFVIHVLMGAVKYAGAMDDIKKNKPCGRH